MDNIDKTPPKKGEGKYTAIGLVVMVALIGLFCALHTFIGWVIIIKVSILLILVAYGIGFVYALDSNDAAWSVYEDSGSKVLKETKEIRVTKESAVTKEVKTVKKLRRPKYTHKEKMDRFEEEAFWMNVFDDEEGF